MESCAVAAHRDSRLSPARSSTTPYLSPLQSATYNPPHRSDTAPCPPGGGRVQRVDLACHLSRLRFVSTMSHPSTGSVIVTRLDLPAAEFEGQRPRLKSVAYRMLGSLAEADDAVQEAWLRLARTDTGEIGNLPGRLTTVVSRLCLDMLRTRTARREEPLEVRMPDLVLGRDDSTDPELRVLLADSVGLALQVPAELARPERPAFVLHDIFGLPFGQTPLTRLSRGGRGARRRVRWQPSGHQCPGPVPPQPSGCRSARCRRCGCRGRRGPGCPRWWRRRGIRRGRW